LAASIAGPFWSRRLAEWTVLTVLVLLVVWAFGRQVRQVQAQAERSAVQSTMGALRTAYVLSHVVRQIANPQPRLQPVPNNPFLLLQAVPPNFAGERAMADADMIVAGTWVFDAACGCIGYRLQYPEWLEEPAGNESIWFRVGGLAGAQQISPVARYVWRGQVYVN
jgi:hypothetical protein